MNTAKWVTIAVGLWMLWQTDAVQYRLDTAHAEYTYDAQVIHNWEAR